MLPDLPEVTMRYLVFTYRKVINGPHDIAFSYRNAERWLLTHVDPKWLVPGSIPDPIISAAVLNVHATWAHSVKDSNAARYCMHALIGPYTKANAILG